MFVNDDWSDSTWQNSQLLYLFKEEEELSVVDMYVVKIKYDDTFRCIVMDESFTFEYL